MQDARPTREDERAAWDLPSWVYCLSSATSGYFLIVGIFGYSITCMGFPILGLLSVYGCLWFSSPVIGILCI